MPAKLAAPSWFVAFALLFVAAAAVAQVPEVVEEITDAPADTIEPVFPEAVGAPGSPGAEGDGIVMSVIMVVAAGVGLVLFVQQRWQKLDGKKLRDRPFEPIIGLALLFMLFAASAVGAVLARQMFFEHEGELEELPIELQMQALAVTLIGSYAGQALALVVAWLMIRSPAKVAAPRLHRPSVSVGGAAALGAAALLLFWPLVMTAGMAANFVQQWLFGEGAPHIAHETLQMILEAPPTGWRSAVLLLVIVGAAIFEEIFYRGILHRMLRGMAFLPWTAIFITSGVFAVMHVNVAEPHALVALFVFSLGLGWIYERTGRLAAPIAMHMAFNLVNAVLALSTAPA